MLNSTWAYVVWAYVFFCNCGFPIPHIGGKADESD